MAKYRKKPVVIEAEQWLGPETSIAGVEPVIGLLENTIDRWVIHTLEGPLNVSPGDWIITGVKGEKYPCKPDIFSATYEPA
jgi:hypothetical protein